MRVPNKFHALARSRFGGFSSANESSVEVLYASGVCGVRLTEGFVVLGGGMLSPSLKSGSRVKKSHHQSLFNEFMKVFMTMMMMV